MSTDPPQDSRQNSAISLCASRSFKRKGEKKEECMPGRRAGPDSPSPGDRQRRRLSGKEMLICCMLVTAGFVIFADPVVGGGIIGSGIAVFLVIRQWETWRTRRRWVRVLATCSRRRIRKCRHASECSIRGWTFDLWCTYSWKGRTHTAIPRPAGFLSFFNAESVQFYLDETIQREGTCVLWVEAENPQSAFFHHRPKDPS